MEGRREVRGEERLQTTWPSVKILYKAKVDCLQKHDTHDLVGLILRHELGSVLRNKPV